MATKKIELGDYVFELGIEGDTKIDTVKLTIPEEKIEAI